MFITRDLKMLFHLSKRQRQYVNVSRLSYKTAAKTYAVDCTHNLGARFRYNNPSSISAQLIMVSNFDQVTLL